MLTSVLYQEGMYISDCWVQCCCKHMPAVPRERAPGTSVAGPSCDLFSHKPCCLDQISGFCFQVPRRNRLFASNNLGAKTTDLSGSGGAVGRPPGCNRGFCVSQCAKFHQALGILGVEWSCWSSSYGWSVESRSDEGFTSCIVKSFRSRRSFISSPLWTP